MLKMFFLEASFYFQRQNGKVINLLGKQDLITFLNNRFIFFLKLKLTQKHPKAL